jgi:predicted RNA-binding protein associated with RNAse of E/G family
MTDHPQEARETVDIHYRRLPDRVDVFRQWVVERTSTRVVTFLEKTPLEREMRIDGRTVLEPGSPVVWHTYPDRWYDVGRFHLRNGIWTGYYANLLTPVRMTGSHWVTTDLCLDVWLGSDGSSRLLDEDELARALREGWLDPNTARTVRQEARSLLKAARAGQWPGTEVLEWDLGRARAAACAPS